MKPLAHGYHPDLIAIDELMVACGRPQPPAVAWIARAARRTADSTQAWNAATADWRTRVEAWEEANPEQASEWAVLNLKYRETELRLDAAKFKEAEQAFTYERLLRLGCPKRCVDAVREPRDEPALKKARDFWYDAAWSLVLSGGPGTGKSTAATWLALQYTERQEHRRIAWVDAPHESQQQLYGAEADVRRGVARGSDVLVLDDLFVTRGDLKPNPAWGAWLEDVLGSRADNSLKTVITTNCSRDELKARLSPRVLDRLRMGLWFGAGAESLRGAA